MSISTRLGPKWAALPPAPGFWVSLCLVALVALADYLSGHKVRLALLYVFPIALATWTGGMRAGIATALAAASCWLLSIPPGRDYSTVFYPYWEVLELGFTFALFLVLLTRLRAALARADERFVRVLEGLQAGIYVVESGREKLAYSNRRLGEMMDEDPLSLGAARLAARFGAPAATPAPSSMPARFTSHEVHDRQSQRWYLVQSGQIPWEGGRPATLNAITDISDQKQAEMLKRKHQEALHNTAHFTALAEIATALGHELNQPLMAISGYLEASLVLLSSSGGKRQAVGEALQKCQAQTVRASRIVEGTRAFLRRKVPAQSGSDINLALRSALQALELELQDAHAAVGLQLDERLPPIPFDQTLIEQVVINLLHNAVDAVQPLAPERRRILLRSALDAGGAIVVTVGDNGSGISAEAASQLYTPFYTTKPHGLGLGLCICRSVVEAHAGRLWHSVGADGGTEFHFTLSA